MVDKVDKKAAVIDVAVSNESNIRKKEAEKDQDLREQMERMRVPVEEQVPGTPSVLGTGELVSRTLELPE